MRIGFLFVFLLSILACNNSENDTPPSMEGVWESVGYGRIVKIEEGNYIMAEVTSISCIPIMNGDISEFGEALSLENDTIKLIDGINRYYFTRIEDSPAICKKDSPERTEAEQKTDDPEYNFEVLWETFNDHYAYFELRKINWDSMYKVYRPKVSPETTPVELYKIMTEMLDAFKDGHIGLDASEEVEKAAYAEKITKEKTEQAPKQKRLSNYQVAASVAAKYIPNGKSLKHNNLRWGTLDGNVGYLQLNQMMGLADYGISDTLSYRDYWMTYFELREESDDTTTDELEGINDALDKIMKDLGSTKALIIDVRFNGGGKDEVGMALLSRLNSETKTVFTKKGRMGNGFTPTVQVKLDASENPYSSPVYLLISIESASATEIMTLCALSMDNVTLIGSNTEGVFSDILDRVLPNGWTFGLSSEVYETMDGINYEGIGIPAKIDVGYPRDTQLFLQRVMNSLEKEGDASIEKALELIGN
jgi:carboxyl-terminal processing protease